MSGIESDEDEDLDLSNPPPLSGGRNVYVELSPNMPPGPDWWGPRQDAAGNFIPVWAQEKTFVLTREAIEEIESTVREQPDRVFSLSWMAQYFTYRYGAPWPPLLDLLNVTVRRGDAAYFDQGTAWGAKAMAGKWPAVGAAVRALLKDSAKLISEADLAKRLAESGGDEGAARVNVHTVLSALLSAGEIEAVRVRGGGEVKFRMAASA